MLEWSLACNMQRVFEAPFSLERVSVNNPDSSFGTILPGNLIQSSFSGTGWGQQLFSFQSPAVQWIARTSSLNCLSCRNPHQTPRSLNCIPQFTEKPFLSLKSASSHPLPRNRLWLSACSRHTHRRCDPVAASSAKGLPISLKHWDHEWLACEVVSLHLVPCLSASLPSYLFAGMLWVRSGLHMGRRCEALWVPKWLQPTHNSQNSRRLVSLPIFQFSGWSGVFAEEARVSFNFWDAGFVAQCSFALPYANMTEERATSCQFSSRWSADPNIILQNAFLVRAPGALAGPAGKSPKSTSRIRPSCR